EAAVDLARLAGLPPVAVICEVLNDDGSTSRLHQLEKFAEANGMAVISIAQLIEYRRRREKLIQRTAEATIPTPYGNFKAIEFESLIDGRSHVAFVLGDPGGKPNILVRVHSECFTGDVLTSLRCDCGAQM